MNKASEKRMVLDAGKFTLQADYPYVIVRTYSAGVFAGELVRREGKEVEMRNARRLWRWSGAASLSQLAMEGVTRPRECLFPVPVLRVILTEAVEILDVTPEARNSIEGVPVWRAHGQKPYKDQRGGPDDDYVS